MAAEWVCWRCGASIAALGLPLQRRAECPACRADLYVCRMCSWFDERVARHCREPIADAVQNKERANFCGYFQPRPGAFRAAEPAAAARSAVDALFGLPATTTSNADAGSPQSEAERARRQLAELFGTKEADKKS